MLDLNSIMDMLVQEDLLTIDMQDAITAAHPYSNLQYADIAQTNSNLQHANSDSKRQHASRHLIGSNLAVANRDHPDKNRELLKVILRRDSVDGQACFCVFIKGLVNTGQGHLAILVADGLRIAWLRRDYVVDYGLGTTSTQLRDCLVNLETLQLKYAPDASSDATLTSPTQDVIRRTWCTDCLTNDQITELLNNAFPRSKNFRPDVYTDECGMIYYVYTNVQKRVDILPGGVQATE
jgi:hypothetical protein